MRRRPAEIVLALDVRARGGTELVGVVGREPERSLQHRHLDVVDRHLQRDIAGQLAEPADVGDDHRLAERERADHRARRLAHRREAQVDEHVARGHQLPHPLLGR
jgi:hypothetical protein